MAELDRGKGALPFDDGPAGALRAYGRRLVWPLAVLVVSLAGILVTLQFGALSGIGVALVLIGFLLFITVAVRNRMVSNADNQFLENILTAGVTLAVGVGTALVVLQNFNIVGAVVAVIVIVIGVFAALARPL